ncbi:MAG: DNA translocase FtsK 4TM domain-containing protein [Bacillota bacterium]
MAKKRRRVTKKERARRSEITGIVLVALALVLLISLLVSPATGGAIGNVFSKTLNFLAGTAAIIIPIFLLFWGALLFINKDQSLSGYRLLGLLMLFFAALGLIHLYYPEQTFGAYMITAAEGVGGGVLGGMVSYLLRIAFGMAASIVILLASAAIGVILLLDVSFAEVFGKLGLGDPQQRKKRAEAREKRRLEKAQRRAAVLAEQETEPAEESTAPEQRSRPRLRIISSDEMPEVTDSVQELDDKLQPRKNIFAAEFFPEISKQEEEQETDLDDTPKLTAETTLEEAIGDNFSTFEANTLTTATKGMTENSDKKVASEQVKAESEEEKEYILPAIDLMTKGIKSKNPLMNKKITDSASTLESTLENFGIKAKIVQVVAGPAVTRYELQPAPGVKVSRITGLADDIALSLAATDVRIEAPIPGKSAIGIEVPRKEISTVYFREVLESKVFQEYPSKIAFALGKGIDGDVIVGDLAKMPHLLIAGSTGSGKSICINSLIASFLYKAKPSEVKLMLIDPKKVELTLYNGLPHLVSPVITDSKKAAASLKWVVNEMENRYTLFSANGVKDFKSYNHKFAEQTLPQLVVIIDELADLMLVAPADVEESICRIAQMARAAGIHLVIATQRPSVDVITGLIKANIPSRIAFAVSSNTDSRTILDMGGAEKLLGRGDMLYHPIGKSKPQRIQGTFIAEKDIVKLVEYCHSQAKPLFLQENVTTEAEIEKTVNNPSDEDSLFFEAAELILTTGQASTSFLQRRLRIGNPRAGRLIDILEANGVVSGPDGSKPRNVLMTMDEFNERFRLS